jgi:hypothetical protein
MPHDISNTTEGWNLRKRYYLAVMKAGTRCLFCDTIAGWRWELVDSTGRTVQWYDVCGSHTARLRVSKDDLNTLVRNERVVPCPKSITCEELEEYLGSCHFIPAGNGLKSNLHKRFSEFSHIELMLQLREVEVVNRSEHFSGFSVRDHFVTATLLEDGSWEAVLKIGETGRTRVVRSAPNPYIGNQENMLKRDSWDLKTSTAKYLVCHVCGNDTRWGQRRGRYRVCDEHDSWSTCFKIITKRIPPHNAHKH